MVRWAPVLTILTASLGVGLRPPPTPARAETVDPKSVGLDIPAGPVRPGAGRRVALADGDQSVVGRLYVEVGNRRVILLPDGRLVTRTHDEAPDSDHVFQPAAKEKVASRWTDARLPGFQAKITRHYVFVHNTSDEFLLVTSRVLESMVPGVLAFAELVKLKAQEPELPLVVLMFRTEAQFQQFRRMPPGIVAYYDPLENYVVLYEESLLKDIGPQLALQQSLATIAHEGAHQILNNTGIQQRLSVWPMWLNEGLAEYLAPTSTGKQLKWKGAGQVNDLRMFELEQYLKSRDGETADGVMVEQTVLAARLTSTGYASAWALTHFLAKNHRSEFNRLLADASRLGPLEGDLLSLPPGVIPGNLTAFRQTVALEPAALEKRLVAHLKKLPYTDPFADWPHWVAMVTSGGGARVRREANIFHSPGQADQWRVDLVEKLPADQRGSAKSESRRFPNRQAAETFARQWLGK